MRVASKSAAFVIMGVSLSLLTGCSSLRLYDEMREKQGATAKEAWAKVDLTAMVKTDRANLTKLLDLELETQDQLATGIRNNKLRALVEGKIGEDVVKPTNDLLTQLVGPADQFKKVQSSLGELRTNARKLQSRRDAFEGLPFDAPSCEEIKNGKTPVTIETAIAKLSAGRKAIYQSLVQELDAACKEVKEAGDADAGTINAYRALGGEMAAAINQYETDKASFDAERGKDASLKLAYKAAREEYDAAVAAYELDSTKFQEVKEKAETLRQAAAGLAELQDAFSIQLLSEGRLKSIDTFFKTVASTDPEKDLPKDTSRTAESIALLADLVDKSSEAFAEAKKPHSYPLLMRRNYEQFRLEAATREIVSRKAMVDLSRQLMDAIFFEAVQVQNASESFRDAGVNDRSTETVLAAFSSTDKNKKELLYNGTARYLDAVNRLDARRYKLQYMRIAAIHERALAYTEVNLKQWESLIGTTVNQVADYSAGGIRSQDITALINAVGLAYIGVGVNK